MEKGLTLQSSCTDNLIVQTGNLLERPDEHWRQVIRSRLWGTGVCKKGDTIESSSAFWSFYTDTCQSFLGGDYSNVSIRTHEELLDIADELRADKLRVDIREKFRPAVAGKGVVLQDRLLDKSINLAATVLLMVEISDMSYEKAEKTTMRWIENESLRDSIRATRFGPKGDPPGNARRLEKIFNAFNLERIAGLNVQWTDNLFDHLRLTNDDNDVLIFHHISYLHVMQQDKNSIIPVEVLKEAIDTLQLLFPTDNNDLKTWYKDLAPEQGLDTFLATYGYLRTGNRNPEHFNYWYDRLMILKQVFDESQPKTLRQYWYDRRNGPQWWGFLNAMIMLTLTLMTILIGLVQIGEAAVQMWTGIASRPQSGR